MKIVAVPRQAGKTTWAVEEALRTGATLIVKDMQKIVDANEKLVNGLRCQQEEK